MSPQKRKKSASLCYPGIPKAVAAVLGVTAYNRLTNQRIHDIKSTRPRKNAKTRRLRITLFYPKLWRLCLASPNTQLTIRSNASMATPSRITSRNRRTSHPSNHLPSPEKCDNLCDSVRLIYATWSAFFSAKILPARSIP